MPKVPEYQANQVQDAGIPDARTNANTTLDNYRSPLTGAMEQVPSYVKVFQEQKKKADDIAVTEADAQLSKLETDLLYDKDNGATNKRGKAAFDVPETVSDGYNKGAKGIEDNLKNDEQKAEFRKKQLERGVSIDRVVQKHVGGEIIRYDNDNTQALLRNEQDAAIASLDPERISLSVQRQKEEVEKFAQRNGLSQADAEQKSAELISKTHSGVINRMLTNDQDQAAKAYFEANKDGVKGDDLAAVEKLLEVGSSRGTSQRFVDGVLKKKVPETEALSMAREQFKDEPKMRDTVYDRIKMEYAIRDSAKKKDLEDMHVNALNVIDQGGGKELTKVRGWTQMEVGQRNSLTAYAKLKAEGKEPKTDWNYYTELQTKASTEATRDEFLKEDPTAWRLSLNDAKYTEMVKLQSSMRKGDRNADGELKNFTQMDTSLKAIFKEAGFAPDNKDEFNKFKYMLGEQQDVVQRNTGKKMSTQEYKDAAREMVKKRVLERDYLWNTTVSAFDGDPDDLNKATKYNDIPKTKIVALEKFLRSNSKPVTPENVRILYVKSLLRGKK